MRYIVLLRGINVGGKNRVEMVRLKSLLKTLGYTNIGTYLNSGNAMFDSEDNLKSIEEILSKAFEDEFGFSTPILIKSKAEIKAIADSIPDEWLNDKDQKTDVAYLFADVDNEGVLDEIPLKREFAEVLYVKGAVIWHIMKKDYNKSQLNKLIGRKIYQRMTVRNVNTARYLAKV